MTVYELLDIGLAVGNRLDVQWGLFITVHLAVFGGIIYVNRPLRVPEKASALAIYLAFLLLDYRVMRLQMNLLQNAYRAIADRAQDSCCINDPLVAYIAEDVASGRFGIANGILVGGHGLMAVLVVVSVVFDREIGAKGHRG